MKNETEKEKIQNAKVKRALNIANKYWVTLAIIMMGLQYYDADPIFGQIATVLWILVIVLGIFGFWARDNEKNIFYADYLDKIEELKKLKNLQKLEKNKKELEKRIDTTKSNNTTKQFGSGGSQEILY